MDLRPKAVFLHNPSAASIEAGLEAGEFLLGGILPFFGAQVNTCDIQCATPCLPQVYTITFNAVDFGTCNECGLAVSFLMRLRRQSNFDIEDYLHLTSSLEIPYEPEVAPTGATSAETIRDWYIDYFNNAPYDDEHDFFNVSVAASGTDDLVITVNCPIQLDIFVASGSEPITIVETDSGQTATLTRDQLLKQHPLMIGYVPGQDVDDTFTGCEDICLIEIQGCIPSCAPNEQVLIERSNAVHLHEPGTKFHYMIYVNSTAPGYTAFIDALNTAVVACTLAPTVGSQNPIVQAPGAGALLPLDLTAYMTGAGTGIFTSTADPLTGIFSNGTVTVGFSLAGAPHTTTEVVNAINTALGGTPLAVDGGDSNIINVGAAFAPSGSVVSIQFTNI